MSGTVYDVSGVSGILGISAECSDSVPAADDGEIVLYYGGWDLQQLSTSSAGKQLLWDQCRYDDYGWKAKPGYYRLLLPVAGSNRQTWSEQLRSLASIDDAWQPAPVCVAATALLVHLKKTGQDLLRNNWCRCAEALPGGRVVLLVYSGRLVNVCRDWDDSCNDRLSLAAARKAES